MKILDDNREAAAAAGGQSWVFPPLNPFSISLKKIYAAAQTEYHINHGQPLKTASRKAPEADSAYFASSLKR